MFDLTEKPTAVPQAKAFPRSIALAIKAQGQDEKAPSGYVEGWASKFEVDRYGELVAPEAFAKAIANFMKNPVLSAGHDISGTSETSVPLGSVRSLEVRQEGLYHRSEFASHEFAQLVRGLYAEGHMRGFSVQFIPKEWRQPFQEEVVKYGANLDRVFTEIDLIELACCPVPVNAGSLMVAAKSMSLAETGMPALENTKKFLAYLLKRMSVVLTRKALSDEQKSKVAAAVGSYNACAEHMASMAECVGKLQGNGDAGGEEGFDATEVCKAMAETMKGLGACVQEMDGHVAELMKSLGGEASEEPPADDGEPEVDEEEAKSLLASFERKLAAA